MFQKLFISFFKLPFKTLFIRKKDMSFKHLKLM